MSDTASAGRKAPIVPLGSTKATRTQPRSSTQRTQEYRRNLIVGCGILLLMILGAAVVIATEFPISTKLLQAVSAVPGTDAHAGKITNDLSGSGCFQQEFDNKTGRITRLQGSCETVAHDSNGVPIPVGTIHRLNAISKAFSSH